MSSFKEALRWLYTCHTRVAGIFYPGKLNDSIFLSETLSRIEFRVLGFGFRG